MLVWSSLERVRLNDPSWKQNENKWDKFQFVHMPSFFLTSLILPRKTNMKIHIKIQDKMIL